jgi:hypothetical protein
MLKVKTNIIACLFIFNYNVSHGQEIHQEIDTFQILNHVVRIQSGDKNGYGFIIGQRDNTLYIVTDNHVVRDTTNDEASNTWAFVFLPNVLGDPLTGKILDSHSKETDLAVIKIIAPSEFTWSFDVQLTSKANIIGRSVSYVGGNGKWEFSKGVATIKDTTPEGKLFISGIKAWPGISGGVIVSENGVEGLVLGNKEGLSFEAIKHLIDKWKYPWGKKSSASVDPREFLELKSSGEAQKRLRFSGYIQSQFQHADLPGQSSFAGGDFAPEVDNRFMIRRGRIRVQYDSPTNKNGWPTSQYVLQINANENGLAIRDAYAKFTEPFIGWFSFTMGMQSRPFDFEVKYSPALLESPESGRMSQTIFPNEKDLGMLVSIQGPRASKWNWIYLDAGIFNGTGAPEEGGKVGDFDRFKDFIGNIGVGGGKNNARYAIGLSYYYGSFASDTAFVYRPAKVNDSTFGFVRSEYKNLRGSEEKRQYIGFNLQYSIKWMPGTTILRTEYIQGAQPGTSQTSMSPSVIFPAADGIYRRKFNGAYFYFIQNIFMTPLSLVIKYDWYDPNTEISGNEIGKTASNTGATDLKYQTLGLGFNYRLDSNLKITFYYDLVKNEKSVNLIGYENDLKDNVFTARAQVKF